MGLSIGCESLDGRDPDYKWMAGEVWWLSSVDKFMFKQKG